MNLVSTAIYCHDCGELMGEIAEHETRDDWPDYCELCAAFHDERRALASDGEGA